jgi:predicted small lipoprotein YifL
MVLKPVAIPLTIAAFALAACGADGPPIRPEAKNEKRQIVEPVGPQPGAGGSTDQILGG